MKAISLWQPWASLIACGAKIYETRDWAPPRNLIGQPIAIHAAKKVDKGAAEFAEEIVYGQFATSEAYRANIALVDGFPLSDKLAATTRAPDSMCAVFGHAVLPVGCVVCIARLRCAYQVGEAATTHEGIAAATVVRRLISDPRYERTTVALDDFGDYSPGRWAWLLTDVKPLVPPIAMKGAQGFFELPPGWLCP